MRHAHQSPAIETKVSLILFLIEPTSWDADHSDPKQDLHPSQQANYVHFPGKEERSDQDRENHRQGKAHANRGQLCARSRHAGQMETYPTRFQRFLSAHNCVIRGFRFRVPKRNINPNNLAGSRAPKPARLRLDAFF
jgi:hypothetical protein